MTNDCIFCQIIADGSVRNRTIYEDEQFIVFLDQKKLAQGHVLIVPKKHYKYVWDYPEVGKLFEVAKKVALHFQQVLHLEEIHVLVTGEHVPHAHVHIVPATAGLWRETLHSLHQKRKLLTPEETKIDPELVKQLKFDQ